MAIEHVATDDIQVEALRWVQENKEFDAANISKGYQSPRISSEIPDCSMPMSFDNLNFCSLGCLYCCLQGTMVQMVDGTERAIEDLDIGDEVLSFNIRDQRTEPDDVASFMGRTVTELYDIELEDGSVRSLTGEHPVYAEERGWVEVSALRVGDNVIRY